MKKILAIGAHPDDIEFYAGGTLAKMVNLGNEVTFVVATDGRNGSYNGINPRQMVQIRKIEQRKSAQIIGIKKLIYLKYQDGSLEKYVQNLKRDLLDIMVKERPDIVFTFDPQKQYMVHDDFHPDHRALAIAALDVIMIDYTLPVKVNIKLQRPQVFLYNAYKTNKKVNIGNYLLKKKAAIKMFVSQNLKLGSGSVHLEKFRVY